MTDKLPEEGTQSENLNGRLRDLLLNRAVVGPNSSNDREGGAVSISCSLCDKAFPVSQDKVGRSGICPKCGHRIDFTAQADQSAETKELETAPNPFMPDSTFEADPSPVVALEVVADAADDLETFTPFFEADETPDVPASPLSGDAGDGSRTWPTVVPEAVPSAIPAPLAPLVGEEEPLELPSLEDDAEPIFEIDIEDSAAIWLELEDEDS